MGRGMLDLSGHPVKNLKKCVSRQVIGQRGHPSGVVWKHQERRKRMESTISSAE